jgi:hypothetical protein
MTFKLNRKLPRNGTKPSSGAGKSIGLHPRRPRAELRPDFSPGSSIGLDGNQHPVVKIDRAGTPITGSTGSRQITNKKTF